MPLVKRLRIKGGNIVVVANAELLFTPTGMMSRWNNSISQRVRNATAGFAPDNRRPRWAHYGKPLKASFRSTTAIDAATMQTQAAISSTAPHAMYVDQGTSSFNAKILPPLGYGSPTLYEATWRPPGSAPGTQAGAIRVKGQKAQRFFEKGLDAGMAASGIILHQGVGSLKGQRVDLLAGFSGATVADAGFIGSLELWRSWRAAAWQAGARERQRERTLNGRGTRLSNGRKRRGSGQRYKVSETDRKARRAEQARRRRAREREQRKEREARNQATDQAKANREKAAVLKSAALRFKRNLAGQPTKSDGRWIALVRGKGGVTSPYILTNDGWVPVRRRR